MMMKKSPIISLLMLLLLLLPVSVEASTNLPFSNGKEPTLSEQVSSWSDIINGTAPTVSFIMSALFTIMFLVGVVRMGYSLVTKTGQVMKFSTGLLIWVPISYFFIRILTIFIFTTNEQNVTLLASDIVNLIKATGYYTSIGMVLIGLALFMFFRFIEHPEFGRWSKRLWVSAALLTILTTLMPIILGAT